MAYGVFTLVVEQVAQALCPHVGGVSLAHVQRRQGVLALADARGDAHEHDFAAIPGHGGERNLLLDA